MSFLRLTVSNDTTLRLIQSGRTVPLNVENQIRNTVYYPAEKLNYYLKF